MAEIEALRRQRMTGPQIARTLGMARSTVGLILRRLGLGRLALLDPKPPIIRYERDRPGEMIHLDIKKLGRINGVGHRFTGRGLLPLLAPPLRARPWHPRRSASTSAVRTWALGRHGPQG